MPASQAPQPSATPSPTQTRRSQPWSTSKLKITATANAAIFAIAAHAGEREAHSREVEQYGADLPEGSYGRRNRQAIAARETRVATRLRAVEHACHTAIEGGAVFGPPEPIRTPRSPEPTTDREIKLD
jgi:hypothetical protein